MVDLDWSVIFTYGLSKLAEAWSAVDLVWIMVDMVFFMMDMEWFI
jgi:hypothetical protein